ncbi:uncharacterized protein LOC120015350 [Tripterygium wilfordii]|uniref:uncharacterized protein LOC120015350 n=1 Tax=Tripterygium wilfordii TaxID=458696 RepID=UPI0018F83FA9|nr:uncharacterized protein LOC120015350 [Tripterygium wilfordii]
MTFPWFHRRKSETRMELELVSLDHFHQHDLVFSEDLLNNSDGGEILCFACLEPAGSLGATYNCIECYFFLHKSCGELPSQIKHPLHRKHSLVLLPNSPYPRIYSCNFCGIWSKNYVYRCSPCDYDLHPKCALLSRCLIQPDSQNHRFTGLMRSDPFTCNFCGVYTNQWAPNKFVILDRSPSLCTECHIVVHRKCISLLHSHTIKIPQHDHSLTHTYFITENESVDIKCRICSEEVNREFGSYCCHECRLVCHVNCSQGNKLYDSSNSLVPLDKLDEELICWPQIEDNFKLGKDMLVQEIDHCSHEHRLTLQVDVDCEVKNSRTYCDGCIQPISAPFYRCEKCDFNLHKLCTELPPKIIHPLHQEHPLTLFLNPDGFYHCFGCSRYCHGFMYSCGICPNSLKFDVRCALVNPFKFNHDGHQHPLILTINYNTNADCGNCSACGTTHFLYFLQCNLCPFSLDYRCATLPHTVKHKYDDKHPFELTYQAIDDGSDEYYCDICEEERSQHHWYYYCAKCDHAAHPECALGMAAFIKGGRLWGRDSSVHHHDLFFERMENYGPPCSSCGKRCYEMSLECHELDCNFRLHWHCMFKNGVWF